MSVLLDAKGVVYDGIVYGRIVCIRYSHRQHDLLQSMATSQSDMARPRGQIHLGGNALTSATISPDSLPMGSFGSLELCVRPRDVLARLRIVLRGGTDYVDAGVRRRLGRVVAYLTPAESRVGHPRNLCRSHVRIRVCAGWVGGGGWGGAGDRYDNPLTALPEAIMGSSWEHLDVRARQC